MRTVRPQELLDMVGELFQSSRRDSADTDAMWTAITGAGWNTVARPESSGGVGGTLADAATLTRAVAGYGFPGRLAQAQMAGWATGTSGDSMIAGSIAWTGGELRSDTRVVEVIWFNDSAPVVLVDATTVRILDPADCTVLDRQVSVSGDLISTVRFDERQTRHLFGGPSPEKLDGVRYLFRAATLLGAAEGAYRLAREYASVRKQFGRTLDSIPAVRSSLARMRVELEMMEAAMGRATYFFEGEGSRTAAALALGACADRASSIAETCHQLCGALGTTLECPLHRRTRQIWGTAADDGLVHDALVGVGIAVLQKGEAALWDAISAPGRELKECVGNVS